MKRALISTLFNEADNLDQWWACLLHQTVQPDELVIVDGGSTDGTWEKLQTLAGQSLVTVKLEQKRCNIAEGRNRAIQLTDAEIIAATDGGSFTEPEWFSQITRPLMEDPELDVVGGRSILIYENEFQKYLRPLYDQLGEPQAPENVHPSSRNVAFRREAWAEVGGYPEWLTLTAEDALFNFELHKIGKVFSYNSHALVRWPVRADEEAHFKMLFSYAYGAAEAQLYAHTYRLSLAVSICPPLLLLSRHRFRHLKFRYLKNLANARGWLAGKFRGKRPPKGWRRIDGILLSPESQSRLI